MDGNRQQRPHSPNTGEGAPSPSKRQRLDGAQFNGPQGLVNRGQPGMPSQQVGAGLNAGMVMTNGISASNLAAQQFQNFPGPQGGQNMPKTMQQYTNSLAQHQQGQMPKGMTPTGPQSQGSPGMVPGQEGAIANYYMDNGANAPRQPGVPAGGQSGSHALQDYQMQLMLLEQQNKKRLLMARQEQDNTMSGGQGGPGPNGQPFTGTSPQGGPRSLNSPNPGEQMKRGTPQMAAGGIPSPDGQCRGSPASMNFMPNSMDPSMAPHFYKNMNGMEGNIGPNGMRQPPSSHPAAFTNGQMNQQQVINIQRQQQQQQQANVGQVPGWPSGPNAAPIMQQQGSHQGAPPTGSIGTPQQRSMPPPSVPAATQAANGRTQPSSPQQPAAPPTPSQANKAKPKAKKDTKPKVRFPIILYDTMRILC